MRYRYLVVLLACSLSLASYAKTTKFSCAFLEYSDNTGGLKEAEEGGLRMTFLIDSAARKAYVLGNAGSSEVMIVPNEGGFTLIEVTNSGNVMVTAITWKGLAVHSRNGIMGEQILPSQYYGKCVAK
jgi:hypothetical protein